LKQRNFILILIAITTLIICCAVILPQKKTVVVGNEWKKLMLQLKPLQVTMGEILPGDWLETHPEDGQTFTEYLKVDPIRPDDIRKIIYIQPIGSFNEPRQKVLNKTVEFMELFFGLPVKVRKNVTLKDIPARARRFHRPSGNSQILSTYILDEILKPNLPKDAVTLLALSESDLWPGAGYNFVFGQASLYNRVGVWSMKRNGDPGKSDAAFKLCLIRTIKTAIHETGHMFSIHHCTQFECGMCGSNSNRESDRRPLWFCSHCMAKICWSNRLDPLKRYKKLATFCKENNLLEGKYQFTNLVYLSWFRKI